MNEKKRGHRTRVPPNRNKGGSRRETGGRGLRESVNIKETDKNIGRETERGGTFNSKDSRIGY